MLAVRLIHKTQLKGFLYKDSHFTVSPRGKRRISAYHENTLFRRLVPKLEERELSCQLWKKFDKAFACVSLRSIVLKLVRIIALGSNALYSKSCECFQSGPK